MWRAAALPTGVASFGAYPSVRLASVLDVTRRGHSKTGVGGQSITKDQWKQYVEDTLEARHDIGRSATTAFQSDAGTSFATIAGR